MNEPAISAIVITPDTWHTMGNTLAALQTQTIRAQIQLVLVGPTLEALAVPDDVLAGFHSVERVSAPSVSSLGEVTAAGVRGATAPIIALTEDHCYPAPDWAEKILRRYAEGEWAGVGPTVTNANPNTISSCVQFIMDYGSSSPLGPKGSQRQLPGHNSSYRREDLMAYEPDLAWWLEVETILHWDMVEKGSRLYADPDVHAFHWNCSRFWPTLQFSWAFSRVFAAYRCARLTPTERVKLAVLWPLIPLARIRRIWPIMTATLGHARALGALPAMFLNLVVSGAGEGLGYVSGEAGSLRRCLDLEFHRGRFLHASERIQVPSQPA
ncbi:MAG: hypothetical protein O2923_11930 [Verrucomicrobia bacterium]|nr:hypothetical protein [Verrucomicrobiota bacterium]MDA1086527.1 hypothetical protein [Verrucomicrobiota bacterium]